MEELYRTRTKASVTFFDLGQLSNLGSSLYCGVLSAVAVLASAVGVLIIRIRKVSFEAGGICLAKVNSGKVRQTTF